jgi:hypothetical protein
LPGRVGTGPGSGTFGYGIGTPGGVGGLVGGEKAASRVLDVPSLTADAGVAETASATTAARVVRTRIMVDLHRSLLPKT